MMTTADYKLQSAREHIREAIRDLSEICVNECDGHDEWKEEYKQRIDESFYDLVRINKIINWQ